jgi:hypothetical protein
LVSKKLGQIISVRTTRGVCHAVWPCHLHFTKKVF